MIQIRTGTNDAGFELLKTLTIGRTVKHFEIVTGNGYTKNHEDIDGIRLFFEDGTRLDITQEIDLYGGDKNNPLTIELYAEAK